MKGREMCEMDLSKADLFADSNRGVYIPQHFAQSVKRRNMSGVSDEDLAILEQGPETEHYWETWETVLDNAVLTGENGVVYRLYQDGDLWIVPIAYGGKTFVEFSDMAVVGLIPEFLDVNNPEDAVTQINASYGHGGGWRDFEGFSLVDGDLHYPGDPVTKRLSWGKLRDETINVYEYGWVAVVQPDNTFRVARID